ncbi:MAG TPA: hypothetical protein VL053_20350 [Arachidicoccus sp.]|nr:hypothetical protein [Arachidicoccus sp.]
MEELSLLQQKLSSLLKLYSALKADHIALQKAISKQADFIQDLNKEKESLQKELGSAFLVQSAGDLNTEQRERIKQQLDKVLDTLNKNIDLL